MFVANDSIQINAVMSASFSSGWDLIKKHKIFGLDFNLKMKDLLHVAKPKSSNRTMVRKSL